MISQGGRTTGEELDQLREAPSERPVLLVQITTACYPSEIDSIPSSQLGGEEPQQRDHMILVGSPVIRLS